MQFEAVEGGIGPEATNVHKRTATSHPSNGRIEPSRSTEPGLPSRMSSGVLTGTAAQTRPTRDQAPIRVAVAKVVTADELDALRMNAELELQDGGRWGTTFTLLQFWGRTPP